MKLREDIFNFYLDNGFNLKLHPALPSLRDHKRDEYALDPDEYGELLVYLLDHQYTQRGLSWDIFDARHEAMRALFGIAVMQRVIASPMQAARSSAVGLLTLASAAVETPPSSKPTAANIPVRVLIMAISLGRTSRH